MSVSLVIIAIHEEPYIFEFINYYLRIGFDKIYIYDNTESNTLCGFNYYSNNKVQVIHFTGKQKQMPAYEHYLQNYRHLHKWTAIFDTDEFLVLKKHNNVHDFLNEYCENGGIAINWKIFGSSNLIQYSSVPVTKRFTKCNREVNKHIKMIFRSEHIIHLNNPHYFPCLHNVRDTNGNEVTSPFNENGPDDIVQLNHYFTKSYNEFQLKKNRGRADINSIRTDDDFNSHDFNNYTDETIKSFFS